MRHQGDKKGLIGPLGRQERTALKALGKQERTTGITWEAGKDQLDSLGSTREARKN